MAKIISLEIGATQFDHIYTSGIVEVRGKQKRVNGHYYLWSNNTWNLGCEDQADYERARALWISGWISGHGKEEPTVAFHFAAAALILEQVRIWAAVNQTAILESEKKYQQEAINNRRETIVKLQTAINLLEAEINSGKRLDTYSKVKI